MGSWKGEFFDLFDKSFRLVLMKQLISGEMTRLSRSIGILGAFVDNFSYAYFGNKAKLLRKFSESRTFSSSEKLHWMENGTFMVFPLNSPVIYFLIFNMKLPKKTHSRFPSISNFQLNSISPFTFVTPLVLESCHFL